MRRLNGGTMPELPEVETVRTALAPAMEGQRVRAIDIRRDGLRWPFPENMGQRIEGRGVLRLRRRAKYIMADLDSGESWLIHLGMSGRVTISTPGDGPMRPGAFVHGHPDGQAHDHVVWTMEDGTRVTFNDPRRFGAMDLFATVDEASQKLLAGLGPEPLGNSFDAALLAARFKGRRMPVKSALLDQRNVAGLGNIYVCEALWRSHISPTRPAGKIAMHRLEALAQAIRDVLREAIDAGGSSLKDYRQADGQLGYFQHRFAVYDRAALPCQTPECAGEIARIVQSGRSTFYCPRCQR